MLSLDRRSKSMDDRKRATTTTTSNGGIPSLVNDETTTPNNINDDSGSDLLSPTSPTTTKQIEKQVSLDKKMKINRQKDATTAGGRSSSKFLEIPSIRYNLISKSFELGLDDGSNETSEAAAAAAATRDTRSLCSRENSEEAAIIDEMLLQSPPQSPSTVNSSPTSVAAGTSKPNQVDRASRISFFRFSKIGKRIRQKLSSSSGTNKSVKRGRSCDDQHENRINHHPIGDDDVIVNDVMYDDDDNESGRELSASRRTTKTTTTTTKWKSASLRKIPTINTPSVALGDTRSAGSSFDSRYGDRSGGNMGCKTNNNNELNIRRAYSSSPVSASRIHVRKQKT